MLFRSACDAPFEFSGAIAGKDHVRVRIDKARQDHSPTRVDRLRGLMSRREISGGAEIDDRAGRDCYCAIGDDGQIAQAIAALRPLSVSWNRQQL